MIVHEKVNPQPSWEFEAEILILHHPTTISNNYQAMGKKLFILMDFSHFFFMDFVFIFKFIVAALDKQRPF